MRRSAGILMPVSSLPSNQGIGDFGKHAFRLIDAFHEQHVHIWQILPLHPIGYGNSPYQPLSSFAGDEIYISLDGLVELNLIKQSSIKSFQKFSTKVDYTAVRKFKLPYFVKAYKNFKDNIASYKSDFNQFREEAFWLFSYSVFISMKKQNNMKSWLEWPIEQKDWINKKGYDLEHISDNILYEQFIQFIFYKQWNKIKQYANERDIKIMGDIPFYVGIDSADVWQNREDFILDKDGYPIVVAGVPPDYFSEIGQRWGNPIYNYKRMKLKNYDFLIKRLQWNAIQYDMLRLDHFRAFDTYWEIDARCQSATEGVWKEGIGYDFFEKARERIKGLSLVVEDLGDLREDVHYLRDYYNWIGMQVLQFNMDAKLLKKATKENLILYSGTHDNDTIMGFHQCLSTNRKLSLRRFFRKMKYSDRNFADLVIQYCLDSNAKMVVIPMQDILGLDSNTRTNTPSTLGSPNWEWKLSNLKAFYERNETIKTWIINSNRK